MSVNRVTLLGRLGVDPELEHVGKDGLPHCELRVATERVGKSGEAATDWITVHTWRDLAERCAQYLRKGGRVYVEGRLQNSVWETEEGERRSRLEVTASRVVFLDRPGASTAGGEEEE